MQVLRQIIVSFLATFTLISFTSTASEVEIAPSRVTKGVAVDASATKKRYVTVSGYVVKPGQIEFRENMQISEAILKAGGFSRLASKKTVKVKRGEKLILVDLKAIERGTMKMFVLLENDQISVRTPCDF